MSYSNYPPGVSGNEPQITGEYPCENCGATLPEEPECPECGKLLEWIEEPRDGRPPRTAWSCKCGYTHEDDFSSSPGGCDEPEYEHPEERG